MKQIFLCFLIMVLIQFRACHPADTISNMMSSMFANKSESSMASMTSTKNTTQTFSSSTSNLLLDAAKKLDITNLTSDEDFLRLLFESVLNIIKDTKSEEFLFISDLTIIIPSIIDKIIKQLQAAFFNIFFGGLVNSAAIAADMTLKIATALETGKLSVASQGIETAQNIADTISSNVPSNAITDAITKMVNTSLDDADGALKAAKTLETAGADAISNVLNKLKIADVIRNPVDISSNIANAVETAILTAATEGIESAKKIADKIAGNLPSNELTDEVKKIAGRNPVDISSNLANAVEKIADKIAGTLSSNGVMNGIKTIANAGMNPVDISSNIANAVEMAKSTAASVGVESAKKIADNIAGSLPSKGVTDEVKKIATASTNPVAISSVISNAVETAKLTAASEGAGSAKKIADKIGRSLPSNRITNEVKKIAAASTNPVAISSKISNAVETTKLTAATEGVGSAKKIADKIGGSLPSNGVTGQIKTIVSTSLTGANGAVKTLKTFKTAGPNAVGGLLNTFKLG